MDVQKATGLRLALKLALTGVLTKVVMTPMGYACMGANQVTTVPIVL